MLRRSLSEENGKDSAEQDTVGGGQVRALQMKMGSLKMKRKTTGGGDGLAESPDEKAEGVSVRLGSSRTRRGKTGPGNFLQKYLWG